MYKVTAYFKDRKVSQEFHDVNDAIEFRDDADAHYPIKVIFRKHTQWACCLRSQVH